MANFLIFADDALRVAATSYRAPDFEDPEDDLSSYGPGKSYMKYDRRMRQNAFSNDWRSMRSSSNGAFFGGVPQIAFASARTQHGEVLSTFIGNSTGIVSYPFLSGVLAPAFRFAAPTGLRFTAPLAASVAAIFAAYGVSKAAVAGIRFFQDWGYKLRHIEQGGDYSDTATAAAFRLHAVNEMSSALSYSRRWLGQEASFMRS